MILSSLINFIADSSTSFGFFSLISMYPLIPSCSYTPRQQGFVGARRDRFVKGQHKDAFCSSGMGHIPAARPVILIG